MRVTFDTTNPTEMAMARKILAQYPETTNTTKPNDKPTPTQVNRNRTSNDWVNAQCRRHPNRRYFVNSFIRQAIKNHKLLAWPTDQYLGLYPRDRSRMIARIVPGGVVLLRDVTRFEDQFLYQTATSEVKNGWTVQITLDSRQAVNEALELLGKSSTLTRK